MTNIWERASDFDVVEGERQNVTYFVLCKLRFIFMVESANAAGNGGCAEWATDLDGFVLRIGSLLDHQAV